MSFYSVQCPNCGKYQSSEIRNIQTSTFKCRRCNRTSKYHDKIKGGLKLNMLGPYMKNQDVAILTSRCNLWNGLGITVIGTKPDICKICNKDTKCTHFKHNEKHHLMCNDCFKKFREQISGW